MTIRPKSVNEIRKGFNDWWARYHFNEASHVHFSHFGNRLRMRSAVENDVRLQWSNRELSCERAGHRFRLELDDFDVKAEVKGRFIFFEFKMSAAISQPLRERLTAIERTKHPTFVSRALMALTGLEEELPKERIDEASAASTDFMVLVEALTAPSLATQLAAEDPLAAARLRGVEQQRNLVEKSGGVLTSENVSGVLGISRQAVDKRRRQGRLIGLVRGRRGYAYPAWQFKNGRTLPELENVLEQLRRHDPWMQLAFFVNGNDRLNGGSPLEALRSGRVKPVLEAAASYGEQGAA